MAILKFATHGKDVQKVLAWLRSMEHEQPGAVFVYLQSLWECNSPECNSTASDDAKRPLIGRNGKPTNVLADGTRR